MLETPHVALGVAIASKIGNPWIAIPLSFVSHFALDRVPHWNPHLFTETEKNGKPSVVSTKIAIIDIASALLLGLLFAFNSLPDWRKTLLILACCLASVASDAIKYPYYYLGLRQKWLVKWVKMERSIQVDTKSVFWGLATQILIILTSFFWIFN